MVAETSEEFRTYGEEFLAQYSKNAQGGFDGTGEDLVATQRIGWYLKEVEDGEARMFQESATMRFVG